jgi:outer membrane protein OmpA-like peptidoglycan-associated protein
MRSDLVARMSAHTRDSEAAISKGFGAAIPLLLRSLAGRADDTSFMSQLTGMAAETAGDAHALRLPQALTGASGGDTQTATGRWLSSLFGSDLAGVIGGVARFAGIGKGSAASVLSLTAPIVLGYLGRLLRSDNFGAAGLSDRLRSQSSAFSAAVPAGLKPVGTSGTRPAEAIPAPSNDWATFDRIVFINSSSELTPESRERIGSIAAALTAHPGARITIAGYTDSSGSEVAKVLSRARANAVRDALRIEGISTRRIQIEGHGSQNPVASNDTEEGRAQNRRVMVKVTKR